MVNMARPYDWKWQRFRLTILDRDHGLCQIRLDGVCTIHAEHVDHIIPLSEGGRRLDPHNCRASCRACNLRRAGLRTHQLAKHALTTLTRPDNTSPNW